MTDLRDARLHKALEAAPDEALRPEEVTREKVRDFAHRAVASRAAVVAVPWWRKLWPATGDSRMPWNAVVATIALATLVTLLWRDEEIPGAKTDADRPAAVAPLPQANPSEQAAPSQRETPASSSPATVPQPEPAQAQAPVRAKAQAPEQERARSREEPVPRERADNAAADALRDKPPGALSKSTPAPSLAPAPAPAEEPKPAAMGRAESIESRAAGTAAPQASPPAPPPQAPAPSAALRQDFRSPPPAMPAAWTQLRIVSGGRSVDVSREQGARLAALMEAAARSIAAPGTIPAQGIRVEVREGDELRVTVDIAGPAIRWTARSAPGQALAGQPPPEAMRALQDEIDRLLAR